MLVTLVTEGSSKRVARDAIEFQNPEEPLRQRVLNMLFLQFEFVSDFGFQASELD
jgi:hypothetical protein